MKIFFGPAPEILKNYLLENDYKVFSDTRSLSGIKLSSVNFFSAIKRLLVITHLQYFSLRIKLIKYNIDEIVFYKIGFENEIFKIANDYPHIKFRFILQSLLFDKIANRISHVSLPNNNIYFYVMTEPDKERIVSMGFDQERIVKVGSLPILLFQNRKFDVLFDICIVSQVQDKWFMDKVSQEGSRVLRGAFSNFLKSLSVILSKYKALKVVIQLRPQASGSKYVGDEKQFFLDRLGSDNIVFVESDIANLKSYQTVMSSRLTVGMFSTMLIEAVYLKRKVLMFDFFSTNSEELANFPYSVSLNDDEHQMIQKFNSIFNMSNDDYLSGTLVSSYQSNCKLSDIFS